MVRRPLCFVLMPYGSKRHPRSGALVDFEAVYAQLIEPAIAAAGLAPYRAKDEHQGGIFHKRMFERLTLCEYAVADLSHANANVYYELGIRHATRPWSTVLLYQSDLPLPLDVAENAAMDYPPSLGLLRDEELRDLRESLTSRLQAAQRKDTDSPVFQLVIGLPVPEVDHRRVDAMLESIDRESGDNARISAAKDRGVEGLRALEATLGDIGSLDTEVSVDLLLAYRANEAWPDMLRIVESMALPLAQTVLVQEQQALALGRVGEYRRAAEILKDIVRRRPSSETFGILGGVYRRQSQNVVQSGGSALKAAGLLDLARDAYLQGFECDWRDPYPGVNAVGMAAAAGQGVDSDPDLVSVVRYAVRRRLALLDTDYWDHACALELAVVDADRPTAMRALQAMLAKQPDPFERHTTAGGLRSFEPLCRARGDADWLREVIAELDPPDAERATS